MVSMVCSYDCSCNLYLKLIVCRSRIQSNRIESKEEEEEEEEEEEGEDLRREGIEESDMIASSSKQHCPARSHDA